MLKIYKFGGALLNNLLGFKQLIKIVSSEPKNTKIILVISAFEKTTIKLKSAAEFAEKGQINKAIEIINNIFEYHRDIVSELLADNHSIDKINSFLTYKKEELYSLMRGISITGELTPRTTDRVLSYGEIISSRIVSTFLRSSSIQNIFFDISKVITTDLNFGSAIPDINITKEKINKYLLPALNNTDCIVTQGFIAAGYSGEITTMGLESSNLTATILAGLLSADELVIWTDVEGIRNADPNIFENTKLISNISYHLAERLAHRGFKLIYPEMINYLKNFNLDVYIKSGLNITGQYSVISREGDGIEHNMCIHRKNISYFEKYGENASAIFNALSAINNTNTNTNTNIININNNTNYNISSKLDLTAIRCGVTDEFPVDLEFMIKILKDKKNIFHLAPDKSFIILPDNDTTLENELILNNYQKIKNIYAITCINAQLAKTVIFLNAMIEAKQHIVSLNFDSNNDFTIYFCATKKEHSLIKNIFAKIFIT